MPNWKKVITSGSDAILNEITSSGGIHSTDVNIDGWGSVSASLASIDSDASNLTLQDITNNGTTTTDGISVGGISVTSMTTGVDNSVVILDSDNTLKTDEIDSRVWGSTLVDASNGSNNRLATFSDSNSLNGEADLTFDGSTFTVAGNTYNTEITNTEIKVGGLINVGFPSNYNGGPEPGGTVVGREALQNNTNGSFNSGFGFRALRNNSVGDSNTAVGSTALEANESGSYNVAVGNLALQDIVSGDSNTAIGNSALKFLLSDYGSGVTDDRNTAIGTSAFPNLLGGVDNIAIGYEAGGHALTNASGSIYIGSQVESAMTAYSGIFADSGNEIVIGTLAKGNGSNTVTIGNSSITNNYFSGDISGSDITIDDWGSVSASLSTLTSDVAGVFDGSYTSLTNVPSGIVSGSITSPSQGTITINGNNIDLGVQSGDSPTFNNLTLTGNLTVEGTRTELQVTELNVEDKNITLASGSTTSAAADGAGITIAGANESLTWNHANSRFQFSDDLNVGGLLNISSVSNAGTDTDKFLVLDGAGNVDYRTGAQVLSDIGGASSALDLDDVTTNGNTTANSIIVGSARIPSGGKLVVGATSNLPYTAHFKSGSDAQMLLETDAPYDGGAGNVAGFRMKVEDTDDDTRAKAGIFFVNTDANDWGRGELLLSTDGTQDNGNATKDDWKLKIDGLNSGKVSIANALNIGSVPNAGTDTDKFLVLDSAGNVDYRTGAQVLSDIGGLESNGGNLTPLQTYIDFKGLTDGHISFGGVIDPMPLDRWMGVWIAPSGGYIDHIRISPENDNSAIGNVDLQLFVNASPVGSPVTVSMGAAGVNKKFTFGSSYSFSEDDRISIHMNKNGNSSDLYAIQIAYRLTN